MTNVLMQILQNQQQQIKQMMTIFINFICTFSSTTTSPLTVLTMQTASVLLTNDNFLYIKFPDPPLFNDNHNKYLI